ncbi:hypothetical protein C5Y96_19615 [Blastopirellula marina]|uniref:Secretin/TonB short N-terminal domain-containing protein n=1 Tax=Blastopirellula marina TaxID=124 RepID=A0A2S8F3F4_9BACT|nr:MULTISPECIES: hypothetical protein [Pirellulaceae]PQO26695.1 hypothetical protein C5Y96_19615 [Blastopirellula marina]RCS46174.1 hypothetical protein DTL36_19645 [Bremerella cremea]
MRAFLGTTLLIALAATGLMAEDKAGHALRPIKIIPHQASQTSFAEAQKWQKKLRTTKADINVIDTPLRDALQFISEQIDVPIRIDHRSLDEVGLNSDAELTLETHKLAADTLLQLLLRQISLTYRIDSTGVVVTTWDAAEANMVRRVYPVGDLINVGPQSDPDYLIDVIVTSVDTPQWEELGGPASITHFQNSLIVDHTNKAHRKVESLIARLREVKNLSSDSYATQALSAFPPDEQTADVEAKLNSVKITVDFIDLPLEDVTAFLAKTSEVPILLDKETLAEIGIATDQPINVTAKDLTLRQTLNILSQQHELSWYVIGGMIIVTSHEEAERELEIRLYPVRDLVWHGLSVSDPKLRTQLWEVTRSASQENDHPLGRTNLNSNVLPEMPDYDNLTKSITSSVRPEWWEELGGPGSIANYPLCDCLVVQQTREVHEEIAELLAEIRSQQNPTDKTKLAQQIEKLGQEVLTVRYMPSQITDTPSDLTREDFQAIGRQMQQLIEPDSWRDDTHFILATQGGLIVRHERNTQEKIAKLLDQIGIGLPVPAKNKRDTGTDKSQTPATQEPGGMGSSFTPPQDGQQGGFF